MTTAAQAAPPSYELVARHSGKSLDVKNADQAHAAPVVQGNPIAHP